LTFAQAQRRHHPVGAAASTSIQNNVVIGEPDATNGGCSSGNSAATAALQVDASSAAGTVEDYNDIVASVPSGDVTPPYVYYAWDGTGYDSSTAFNAATHQGAHDSNATGADAAIDSANSDAPGELSTDGEKQPRVDDLDVPDTGAGAYGYYDRGFLETVDPIDIAATSQWPSTFAIGSPQTFTAAVSDGWTGATITDCAYSFGDGTPLVSGAPVNGRCSAQHTYATAGGYAVRLAVTANDGYQTTASYSVTVEPNELQPNLKLTTVNLRSIVATATPTNPHNWAITSCEFSFGDGTAEVKTSISGPICDASHQYSSIGTHTVSVTVTDAGGDVTTQTTDFTSTGYYYDPVAPVRVLDTRKPIGVATIAKVPANGVVKLKLAGTDGIPADAAAVALNVTVTDAAGGGYVTVYPDGTAPPTTSNVNFSAGQVVPNLVLAKLGADGTIDLKNVSTGTVDLVADLEGSYATAGDGYTPIGPARLVDTRGSTGTIPAGGTLRVDLASATGSAAVVLNATVTNTASGGDITAYPDGTDLPTASNLNFTKGQTVANEVMVQAGADGYVDFTNNSPAGVDLIVDLLGSFSTAQDLNAGKDTAFVPLAPTRVLDTRKGFGTLEINGATTEPAIPAFTAGALPMAKEPSSPVPGQAVAVAANVTVAQPTAGGYLTVWDPDHPKPVTSTLNFTAGQTLANAATVQLGAVGGDGTVMVYNGSGGSTPLVVDVFGYYG
jgi:PKD repeat protein